MEVLKYTLIKSRHQYDHYCDTLESLLTHQGSSDEIELLGLVIEKWDNEHNNFNELDPIALIQALMKENKLKQKDLMAILSLSKGTVSKMLGYHKGLSKASIRKLSVRFKVAQEVLNRPYALIGAKSNSLQNIARS